MALFGVKVKDGVAPLLAFHQERPVASHCGTHTTPSDLIGYIKVQTSGNIMGWTNQSALRPLTLSSSEAPPNTTHPKNEKREKDLSTTETKMLEIQPTLMIYDGISFGNSSNVLVLSR